MQGGKVSLESREGVERKKASSKRSSLAQALPSSGTPHTGMDCRRRTAPAATHSRTYIHKQAGTSLPVPAPPAGKQSSCSRGYRVSPAVCCHQAAASRAAVLSAPLSSLRINSEASGCVVLNHRGACRSRGSDFPGQASGLYKFQRAGHCSHLSHSYCLPERPSEQPSYSTHHVPGRRAQHRQSVQWVWGLGGWGTGHSSPAAVSCAEF